MNPMLLTDSYKLGHVAQYPEGTEYVYSNFTPRSKKHFECPGEFLDDKIAFFGLQAVLKKMVKLWDENFFNVEDFDSLYQEFDDATKSFSKFPKEKMRELWDYGRLPLKIKALPEGSLVDVRVPVLTIINTQPEFYWFTNYIETYLSAELWKLCTSATTAYQYRMIMTYWASMTNSPVSSIDFQGHDFSMRGMSGVEDAISSSAAHLLCFFGTDTIAAPLWANKYYSKGAFGCSVPATEHSVMCAGGKDNEMETIRRLIKEVYPEGIVSIVSDSWDFWQVINVQARSLKDDIMRRNGKVVFRPDSGDPVRILCGYRVKKIKSLYDWVNNLHRFAAHDDTSADHRGLYNAIEMDGIYNILENDGEGNITIGKEISEAEAKGAVEILWDIFGGTYNEHGFKVLDEHVGLIYGDSITMDRANRILHGLWLKEFASNNVIFGIGSYTYQRVTRDTLGFAVKATWASINGEDVNIVKSPKTDNGVKKSAAGLLQVEKDKWQHFLLNDLVTWKKEKESELKTVFFEGRLIKEEDFETIRNRMISYTKLVYAIDQ